MQRDHFQPPFFIKNAYVQTILGSSKLRSPTPNIMRDVACEKIIKTPDDVKLVGYHSTQRGGQPKGLAIVLHGWEGSSDSTYVLRCANQLYRNGYDVFRLNFRDHGDSHHLNTGIFYAVLLEEVYEAVRVAAGLSKGTPVFLIGFSLGGNFVLRILKKCIHSPIANLCHAVSISPVLNPKKSTTKIDRIAFIRKYFLAKWHRSLAKKQKLFPELYDFEDVLHLKSIQAVTDVLLNRYSDYPSAQEYFQAYAVMDSDIENIITATTVITAEDDPIIPIDDFYGLKLNNNTQLVIHSHGGHNGFITGLKLQSWYENRIITLFDEILLQL